MRKFQLFPKEMGVFPILYAIFLVFPLLSLFMMPNSVEKWGNLILFFLYLAAYRKSYFNTAYYWLPYATLLLLSCYFFIILQSMPYFFIYPANVCGWVLGGTKKNEFNLGVISLYSCTILSSIVQYSLTGFPFSIDNLISLFVYYCLVFFTPYAARTMYLNNRKKRQKNKSNKRLEHVIRQEERIKIARDLHDSLGHSLSAISLKTDLALKLFEKVPDRSQQELQEIQVVSRTTLKEVREIVTEMRHIRVMEELIRCDQLLETQGKFLMTQDETLVELLPSAIQHQVSFCIREVVTNFLRHSNGNECFLNFCQQEGKFKMDVTDNGVVKKAIQKGNGLIGMEERIKLFGGKVNLLAKQKSYKMEIVIPWEETK